MNANETRIKEIESYFRSVPHHSYVDSLLTELRASMEREEIMKAEIIRAINTLDMYSTSDCSLYAGKKIADDAKYVISFIETALAEIYRLRGGG